MFLKKIPPHTNVSPTGLSIHLLTVLFKFYRLLNVALTYQIRSYRDIETKENMRNQKRKQILANDRK